MMKLISIIKLRSGSLEKFAEDNEIKYYELYDICYNNKPLSECDPVIIEKIAKGLSMGINDILRELPFPQFRDSLHNSLRQNGDIPWLIMTLKENRAIALYRNNEILHAIYLVDMIDYICRKNNLPCPKEYQHIRELKLKEPFFCW